MNRGLRLIIPKIVTRASKGTESTSPIRIWGYRGDTYARVRVPFISLKMLIIMVSPSGFEPETY